MKGYKQKWKNQREMLTSWLLSIQALELDCV